MSSVAMLRDRLANRNPRPRSSSQGQFVPDDVLANLANLTRADADACDFGIIQVDDSSRVLLYNQYQGNLANMTASQVEGRSFFGEIAPCTNTSLFAGIFKKGVAANNLNVMFPYVFNYKLQPTPVNIHLYRDNATRTNWIFVQRT